MDIDHRRSAIEMIFPVNMNLQPLDITLHVLSVAYWELRHMFFQISPKFSDLPREDPQRNLQDFEIA